MYTSKVILGVVAPATRGVFSCVQVNSTRHWRGFSLRLNRQAQGAWIAVMVRGIRFQFKRSGDRATREARNAAQFHVPNIPYRRGLAKILCVQPTMQHLKTLTLVLF